MDEGQEFSRALTKWIFISPTTSWGKPWCGIEDNGVCSSSTEQPSWPGGWKMTTTESHTTAITIIARYKKKNSIFDRTQTFPFVGNLKNSPTSSSMHTGGTKKEALVGGVYYNDHRIPLWSVIWCSHPRAQSRLSPDCSYLWPGTLSTFRTLPFPLILMNYFLMPPSCCLLYLSLNVV